jgi:predicted nucleic-acid-binding Zn-ribbon protein
MTGVKCCPKCGSTNVNFLVFYRPSTWKCLDCGYEGAFIIEDSGIAGKMHDPWQKRCNIIDWIAGEPRMDNWDGSVDTLQKAFGTT